MADIFYDQTQDADQHRFCSWNWVHIPGANATHLVTVAGVVILDYQGETSDQWRHDKLHLRIRFPNDFYPPNKWFRVDHWAPLVTLNALYNAGHAINAGWAVDEFDVELPASRKIYNNIPIWAALAVRDRDGVLFRVSYTITVSGEFVDPDRVKVG